MTDTQHDENLFVVFAVEEYARRHGITAHETLGIFLKSGVTESIRQCYQTLNQDDHSLQIENLSMAKKPGILQNDLFEEEENE